MKETTQTPQPSPAPEPKPKTKCDAKLVGHKQCKCADCLAARGQD